jgi:signal transduction histidine kinase
MVGRWSIRASLGSLAAVVTLPLLLLVGALFVSQLRTERQEARDEALRLARTTASRLHSLHAESLALLERMAARPAIRNFDGAACDSLFAIVDFYPQYANLYFFDGNGRVLCSGQPAREDRAVSSVAQVWISGLIRSGKLQPRSPLMRVLADRWVSALAVPVVDDHGASRGVLVLLQLPEIFGAVSLPPQSVATVLDRDGNVVARSSEPRTWSGLNVRDTPLARVALRQPEGRTEAIGIDGVSRQYGFTYLPDMRWHVYVGIPTDSVMLPVRRLLVRGLLGGLAIIALVVVAALILAMRIEKPIDELALAAASVTAGAEATVAEQGPREIAMMARAFNEMVVSRTRSQKRIEESERNLKALSERMLLVEEEERRRIARELHDDLGQSLTALKMDVIGLLDRNPPADGTAPIRDRIVRTLDATVTSVQRIAAELRPTLLDDLGLGVAVQSEARLFEERTGIECEVSVPAEDDLRIEPSCATAMFRIVKEALTNVFRHSGASHVEVRIRGRGEELLLEIRDNGRGMTPEEISSPASLGLIGMRERAAVIGGTATFEGVAGRGSIVSVRIPAHLGRTATT